MQRGSHLALLAAGLGLAVTGCTKSDDGGPGGSPRAEMAGILAAVKSETGAIQKEETLWYDADDLYKYIDGGAAKFAKAGFVLLAHTEWRPAGEGKAYVVMDIYDLGSPQGALDVICDSRSEQTDYVPCGRECHFTPELVELRTGRYYVTLAPKPGPADDTQPLVKALAEAFAGAAPPGPSDEELVAPLPAARMVPHTAAYTTRGFLGHDFLTKVREALYESGSQGVRLFVADAGTPEKAAAVFAEWQELAEARPAEAKLMPGFFAYRDEYLDFVVVSQKDRWVAGASGDPAAAQAMLVSLLKQLP